MQSNTKKFSIPRRVYLYAVVLCVLAVIGVYTASRSHKLFASVPEKFRESRLQGALISQTIVELSNQLTEDLKQINALDQSGQYKEAMVLATQLVGHNTQIRSQAVRLSTELNNMAESLPAISSQPAREAGLLSITSNLALISRLINYNASLSQLLQSLQNKFAGQPTPPHTVDKLVEQINAEVTAINNFNRQAEESLKKFNQITTGQ